MRTLAGTEYELEISNKLGTFEIEMLPARWGTSLIVRYGEGSSINQMIVDCGDRATGDLLKKNAARPRSAIADRVARGDARG